METATDSLKTGGNISEEERVGSCSRKALEALARDFYIHILEIPARHMPPEVHLHCQYGAEGRFVADLITRACGDRIKVVLLLPDTSKGYPIFLDSYVEAARKQNQR